MSRGYLLMGVRSAAILAASTAAVLLVAGCSSTGPTARATDAQVIVDQIAQKVPTARKTLVVTARNDPNKLLGTPRPYPSKTEFVDTRLDQGVDVVGGVPAGGTVKVFGDESQATARRVHLQNAAISAGAASAAAEYDYISGPVLLRVSHNLTPAQAAGYSAALDEITR